MESLLLSAIAALTIYDMLKPVDNSLTIESVRLLNKSGGIKEFYERFEKNLDLQYWLLAILYPEESGLTDQARLLLTGSLRMDLRLWSTR